jgi:hypothetical protein
VANDEKNADEEKKSKEKTGSEMPESEMPASEMPAESEDLAEPGEPAEEQGFVKRNNEKPLIPDDFFYDFDSLVFKPVISEESKLTANLVSL